MMNSNLNLSTLPESTFTYQFVNSALLFPCMEYQRLLRTEKVASIAENFSEYIANSCLTVMAALPLPACPRRFYRPNPPHAVTISNIPQKRGLTKPIAPSLRELSAKLTEGVAPSEAD
mgnify:CR=1 FL=1